MLVRQFLDLPPVSLEIGCLGCAVVPVLEETGDAREDRGAWVGTALAARVRERLRVLTATETASSRRVGRALVLCEPPSVKAQEITVKGNLNTRAVLTRRQSLVERLFDDGDPATIRC